MSTCSNYPRYVVDDWMHCSPPKMLADLRCGALCVCPLFPHSRTPTCSRAGMCTHLTAIKDQRVSSS